MDIKLMPEKYKKQKNASIGFKELGSILNVKEGLWLVLSLIFLGLVVLVCLGLWGYKDSLVVEKNTLTAKIGELNDQRDLSIETEFTALNQGIEGLKKALKSRVYLSNILKMTEELTLAQVQFTDFTFDFSQDKFILEAEAVNYNTLVKQILAFEQDSRISKVETSGADLDISGRVSAEFEIELDQAVFK